MCSRFLRRLLFALFLLWCIPTLTAQSSNPTSTKLDPITQQAQPLWLTLESLVSTLPQELDSFMASLQTQTDSLQANMTSLQATNGQLQISNSSLTQANEQLQASLQASQALAETSGQKLARLQTDLNVSTAYTIQVAVDLKAAQDDARALAFGKSLSEYIAFAGAGAAAGAIASKGNLADTAIGAGAGFLLKAALALTHIL